MARARIPEAERIRLREQLRRSEDERRALLREVKTLQGEVCEAGRARARAEWRTDDLKNSAEIKIAGMQQEIAQLKQNFSDCVLATARAHNTQLHQERQLVAAQEQLRRQEESFSALKDECLRLQSEKVQLQSERKGCGQLMAQYSRAPTLVPADPPAELVTFYMTTLQQRDDELQQQIQLVCELEDTLQNQKFELCLARSQTRVANEQLQSQRKTRSSDHQQHQQTVGDRGASEALQPADDHKLLLEEEEVAGLKATVAKYQQIFAYQQEALDLYPPLPPFMPINIQPLTVQADRKTEGCCAKCSEPSENAAVETVFGQTGALAAAAGLQQELTNIKEELSKCNGHLKAACDELAQKQAEVMSVRSSVTTLELEKSELEQQGRCALQSNQLLQEQVADVQRQLLQLQCVASMLQEERDQDNHQHQQEILEYKQVLVAQAEALAAAAGLQQELTEVKARHDGLTKRSLELEGQLKAAYDKLAQKEVELSSVSSTVVQLYQDKEQLQVQGHCALLSNQLLQEQVAGLHCQLLQLQYMVSNLQQQQAQQHLPVASEQALVTVRQQQLKPVRTVRDSSEPADAPSTPELGASSFSEGRSRTSQPNADDASSSSSSSSRHLDTNSSIATDWPASKGSRGARAVSSAAAIVLGIVLSRRKAST